MFVLYRPDLLLVNEKRQYTRVEMSLPNLGESGFCSSTLCN